MVAIAASIARFGFTNPILVDESRGVLAGHGLGSGSTMVAAEQSGRRAFGMELTESHCATILARMERLGLTPQLE